MRPLDNAYLGRLVPVLSIPYKVRSGRERTGPLGDCGGRASQSRQSAKLFLQSSELGLPQPLTAGECAPRPLVQGGGTLACGRGVEGVPIPTMGHTVHCGNLYMSTLCQSVVKGRDTSVRDASSRGRIVQGTHRPGDASIKGRIFQETHSFVDTSVEDTLSWHPLFIEQGLNLHRYEDLQNTGIEIPKLLSFSRETSVPSNIRMQDIFVLARTLYLCKHVVKFQLIYM
jgi:hypothetical protein